MAKKNKPIHWSIKAALGYQADEPDAAVLSDWKKRTSRVCKPCWEIKYCPYGPLVEQSPILPPERQGAVEHNEHFKEALKSGRLGELETVDKAGRKELAKILSDEDLLIRRALHELEQEEHVRAAEQSDDPVRTFLGLDGLPPIEKYRVSYDLDVTSHIDISALPTDVRERVVAAVERDKNKLRHAIETGTLDNSKPLDSVRRRWFQQEVDEFDPDKYPPEIPEKFAEASCNIFGHICPVFFAAEAATETSQERRRGRYIPFTTKMRVVRRDNHTCQHCGTHLRDDQVEFDHIIPISRGGSSEEHNLRLTCFDCNRDKTNDVII